MGSPDPRAYSRNKRGIAGSLVWINFDRHALLDLFYKARGLFVADQDEIRPQFQNPDTLDTAALFNSSVVRDAGPSISGTIDQLDDVSITSVGGWTELATPWYSDQILPFDITLAAANEYGAMAGAKIFGVEILNEGTGVSIDDLVTETQVTLVARFMGPFILRRFLSSLEMPPSRFTPGIPPARLQVTRMQSDSSFHRWFIRSLILPRQESLPTPLFCSHKTAPLRQTWTRDPRHLRRTAS
jgi:hypothetical protein